MNAEVSWSKTVDVVVVGYGFAGANAAISAHDTGAQVLLIEKMPSPGGISICSAGQGRRANGGARPTTQPWKVMGGGLPSKVFRAHELLRAKALRRRWSHSPS